MINTIMNDVIARRLMPTVNNYKTYTSFGILITTAPAADI